MKIVLVTGGFDPLHAGHIDYFNQAQQLGDKLIVGVNSDAWLTRKKGKNFLPIVDRVRIIENLKMSPSNYGRLFLFLSGANLLGSIISRRLIRRLINTFKVKTIGLVLSVIGCILLLVSAFVIDNSSTVNTVSVLIFTPMAIHLMGHSLLVPMLLRHALEDYYKVTGSAGAIFGFLYYMITALVSFMISSLHSNTINNFAILFASLLFICLILFYMTLQWRKTMNKPEFH
ncbi:MAG: hypothetical protein EBS33_00990 [Alphaproteobacteria bacterium]|nr:hypothetical protein [Alphaproteobacteria bacterium]